MKIKDDFNVVNISSKFTWIKLVYLQRIKQLNNDLLLDLGNFVFYLNQLKSLNSLLNYLSKKKKTNLQLNESKTVSKNSQQFCKVRRLSMLIFCW
jgi:uncharacterized membrane protein